MSEYGVDNPFKEPAFYTDLVLNYFISILNGNSGEALATGFSFKRVLQQAMFDTAGKLMVENWVSNFQQVLGYKVNNRYRNFILRWSGFVLTPRKMLTTPTALKSLLKPYFHDKKHS